MGTAQLLYITLGVIIVGLAIFTGLNMYQEYMQDSEREQLINHCVTILSAAEAYHMKPAEAGGGGGSYLGFELPPDMIKNELGKFKITMAKKKDQININAKGTVDGENKTNKPINVIARIIRNKKNPDGYIQIVVRN